MELFDEAALRFVRFRILFLENDNWLRVVDARVTEWDQIVVGIDLLFRVILDEITYSRRRLPRLHCFCLGNNDAI